MLTLTQFYNDFAEQAARLKAETQDWVKQRRDSIRCVYLSLTGNHAPTLESDG